MSELHDQGDFQHEVREIKFFQAELGKLETNFATLKARNFLLDEKQRLLQEIETAKECYTEALKECEENLKWIKELQGKKQSS